MSRDDIARDVIDRVLDRKPSAAHRGFSNRVANQQPVYQAPPNSGFHEYNANAVNSYGYNAAAGNGSLPVYNTQQQGVVPPPLYAQQQGAYAPTRGMAVPVYQMPSRGADTDYVNQAFSEALGRARQKWSFSLMISLIIAGMIIIGITVSGVWMMLGQTNALTALFGAGSTILGVLSWLLARPAAQLNDADNQVSLLMMIWTKYTQDLQGCERITDPASSATCVAKVGDDAIGHFESIVGKKTSA